MTDETTLDETDDDRLLPLDRLAERMPDLDLDQHEIEWTKLDDGNEDHWCGDVPEFETP
jgi:hypothetical protein